MTVSEQGAKARASEYPVNDFIKGRWSPRAMTGEAITKNELFSLFEAARWASSAYNEQPWRMLYAMRGSAEWPLFFNLMVEFNQSWAKDAGALVLFLSRKVSSHNGSPLATHSFDCGSAWGNFALQGTSQNFVVHGMEGFDYERAKKDLGIPEFMQVEAMAAVGKPAPAEKLPPALKEKEVVSSRKPLEKTVAAGKWTESLA